MTTRTPARRVTVLMGGISAERTVSLSSGAGISAALREEGYEVRVLDAGPDLGAIVADLTTHRPDVVFNALHGRLGEDGAIQGVLDWMDIPYTHSGIRASATAMDKAAARAVFLAAGLPVAEGTVIDIAAFPAADPLPTPYVIKPLNEGSSVGVEIVRTGSNRRAAIAAAWTHGPHALVEEFIPGRELTVGVMGDRALTVTDITPNPATGHEFYDYAAKYQTGGSQHVLPARIHPDAFAQALDLAAAAHRALGCTGATRTDFRYDDTQCGDGPGRLVILEVNTQPGMTPTSLLPEQAQTQGIGYGALCRWMVEHATCRT
ncbi:D-alanine--D-alanine ligase [Gluconacetobacter sp. 1b LMG 1731]|uniref:D-alanine--D-alanine ligase n=1 Tax=Gluconacetobacter dulcium TaxID=2729096 RepID=A0A7W4IK03_9PROT|nr:D-alanine--D-alanine ligase [Gluconacetobacter dulcium]MBB2164285.1 D-alanine--D-alanine ligase [Gluconacetobacter dulcium]MBB2193307.1 D-alanine--D-alanine ligase [Gluconacetobacter dulcium]MBB2196250.1 D-alanine--D-alanine ligase [Gluconacetobacter dulcium]